MFKKTKKEVIEMEQTTFVQKHTKKILLAGGVVVAAGAYVLLAKHEKEMKDVLADNALLKSFIEEDGKVITKLTDDNETLMAAASEGLFEEALSKVINKINYRKDKEEFLLDQLLKNPNDKDLQAALDKVRSELRVLFVRKDKFTKAQALIEIKDEI